MVYMLFLWIINPRFSFLSPRSYTLDFRADFFPSPLQPPIRSFQGRPDCFISGTTSTPSWKKMLMNTTTQMPRVQHDHGLMVAAEFITPRPVIRPACPSLIPRIDQFTLIHGYCTHICYHSRHAGCHLLNVSTMVDVPEIHMQNAHATLFT